MNKFKDQGEGKPDTSLTRRDLFRGVAAALVPVVLPPRAFAAQGAQPPAGAGIGPLDSAVLPPGIRSRFVDNVNGLRMHVLEAGFETPGRPRRAAAARLSRTGLQLAQGDGPACRRRLSRVRAGRPRLRPHVAGTESHYDDDLGPFGTLNKINDMLALVSALGYRSVAAVIGHDQGSPLAGWCALARPDVFRVGRR